MDKMDKRAMVTRAKPLQSLVNTALYRCHSLQRGATTVEYTVVTMMVLVALFVPLGGEGSLSAVGYVLEGLRNFQEHTTYLLSMP